MAARTLNTQQLAQAFGNLIQLAKDAGIPEADSMEFRIHE